MTERVKMERSSGNVFVDLGFSPGDAVNLSFRSLLMMKLEDWYKAANLTQTQAAKTLGVTQPRLNLLLKGRLDLFSLDALVNMLARTGMTVEIRVKKIKVKKAPLKKAA